MRVSSAQPSLLGKALALMVAVLIFALAVMFSVVLIAVIPVLGFALWGYLRWKLRKSVNPQNTNVEMGGGNVFDGEVVVVADDIHVSARPLLPNDANPL